MTPNVVYKDILLYIPNILKGNIMKKIFLFAGILVLLTEYAGDKSADNFKSAAVSFDANNNGLADDTYCTESASDDSYAFISSDSVSSYPLTASITTDAKVSDGVILMYASKGKADVISIETTLIKNIIE